MTDSGELIELPNGTAVYFIDDHPSPKMRHSYWRAKAHKSGGGWARSTRLTGVTTAIRPISFDPGGLLKWAAKTQLLGVVELVADAGVYDMSEVSIEKLPWLASVDALWSELERRQLTFDHVRERAAKRGTNVHKLALEALAEGREVPDFEAMTEEERGYARGVVEFWLDHSLRPEQVLQSEQVVSDEKRGVGGRFDLRWNMDDGLLSDGEVGMLDLKTSGFIGEKDHVQVAGYNALAAHCGIGAADKLFILQVSEDGGYDLIPVEADVQDFEAALDVYRRVAKIKSATKRAWEDRRGAF